MKLKIKNEKDLLRYISSLSIDEGLRIESKDFLINILRHNLNFYIIIEKNGNKIQKKLKNENEVLEEIKYIIKFPLNVELY